MRDDRRKLFTYKAPYDLEGTESLFMEAVKENCAFHYANCETYRKILDDRGFNPKRLNGMEDLENLPFIPTLFFKSHELFSMPTNQMLIKATSSGTKGKKSKIGFDTEGLYCGLRMVLKIGHRHQLFSMMPTNYILLGYQPHKSNQMAVSKTAFGATLFAPALHREYALKYREEGYKVDLDGIIECLKKYSHQPFPVRFMGFPSYTYFLLQKIQEKGLRFKLTKGSKILLGGGWKQFYTERVEKEALYSLAKETLGIEENQIVEFFGAVEHPVLYCDCPNHHFHVPIYSRVIIRDVKTLKPVKNGEVGLVNLITPMVKSMPLLSVMTDDLGVLHDGETCGCGIRSPYLEIIGRVGLADVKTCAAGAADLLKGVKL